MQANKAKHPVASDNVNCDNCAHPTAPARVHGAPKSDGTPGMIKLSNVMHVSQKKEKSH